MLKKYFNSSDERRLKEQSTFMFKEISSGVYYVEKDRTGRHHDMFVSSSTVISALNNEHKVSVTGNSGIYSNFELVEFKR